MDWSRFLDSTLFLFVLLNPFLLALYLLDLIKSLDAATFRSVLWRAVLIAGSIFAVFAITGESLFQDLLQLSFSSFQVFGGVVFLIIGIRYVMQGPSAIEKLRGESEHLAGSIAMPFLVGPGTVTASVLAGVGQSPPMAVLSVVVAMFLALVGLLGVKWLHDHVRARHERLVERYTEIVGRLAAFLVGTVAVDMILRGLEDWIGRLG